MSERDYVLFLEDILVSTQKILRYVGNKSFEEFINNELLIDGTIRNLEIIGEAVKNLPAQIKRKYGSIEWKRIAGLRDILIHEYFGVKYTILWDIVKKEIPPLKEQIETILEKDAGK